MNILGSTSTVSMETEVDFKMDMTWDEAYADPNSPETQALTTNLEGAVCIS